MRSEWRPIRYTKHADDQMKLREISRTDVETVIRAGAWEPEGIGQWLAHARIKGMVLKVAFVEMKSKLLVKTAMWEEW